MSAADSKAAPPAAPAQTTFYQLYRRSSLGNALINALDELIQSGHINPQLALKILNQFDKSAANTLSAELKNKVTVKGHLSTYRLCDEVWTFILSNPTFKMEGNESINIPGKCKIVACKAGTADAK